MTLIFKGRHSLNWWLIVPTVILVVLGCVMVFSASSYSALKNYGSSTFFLTKQIVGAVLGFLCLTFFYFVDFNILKKIRFVALGVGLLTLAIVFVPGVGIESYGAKRWIGFGAFSFQASEIAKFCFIVFCSGHMAKHAENMNKFKNSLPILLAGFLMCFLIMLEPNMSITICVGVCMIIMLLVGGIKIKHLMFLGIPIILAIPVLILMEPYRISRIMAYLDPWSSPQGEGYQLIQSLYSLGSGGLFGCGLFNSRAKYSFLPFSESDFIFSIVGEELGFVGAVCVLALFCVLIVAGFLVASRSKNRFGCFLATGISSLVAIQVILNVAVVTGLVPPTGLPLPLMSAGSTSLVMFLSAIGILLNIHRQSKQKVFA